jgi:hypothetical protein
MQQVNSQKTSDEYSPPPALGVRFNSTHASLSNVLTSSLRAADDKPSGKRFVAPLIAETRGCVASDKLAIAEPSQGFVSTYDATVSAQPKSGKQLSWQKNALFVEVVSNKPVGKLSLW